MLVKQESSDNLSESKIYDDHTITTMRRPDILFSIIP